MQVKRALLFWALGSKTNIKAVSLLLSLKSRLDKTSSIPQASLNKIAGIAGVSPNTIKRYMPIWTRLGWVEFRGSNRDIFCVKRMASKTKHRNIDLSRLDMSSFRSIYENLKSFLFLLILARKEFVKRMIRTVNTSRDPEEARAALKSCNYYAERNENGKLEYREWGISYRKIAQNLGFCVRTTENIVKKAIQKRWCHKQTHFNKFFMLGVNGRDVPGFTFTTKNYGFTMSANTYTLNRNICMALIGGKN